MKKFNHVPVELQDIKATNKDGIRLYETPDGNMYPSITTVLSVRNKQGLFEWRKRVGEEVANYIARTAAARGTAVHHMCEDYLNNEDMEKHKEKFLPHALFTQLRDKLLNRIDNIHSQEAGLYSDKYGVAGRVDCIAEFDGVLSIIDFKTSAREKTDERLYDYFVQETAYACMLLEQYNIRVEQLVTIVACEDGDTQVVIRPVKKQYLDSLLQYIDEYKVAHGTKQTTRR